MKFRQKYDYHNSPKEYGIADAVEALLDGRSYDSGQIEEIASTSVNTMRAFGRLVEMLYENQMLTKANVIELSSSTYEAVDE